MTKLNLAISLLLVFVATGTASVLAVSPATPQQGGGSSSVLINPKDYGAIADCKSHPLSSVYPTLLAAQAVYPFITSLSQEVDYAAIKAASNNA
ncbi:MAG TPA: hypothetical protein VN920_08785, partial [Pyrinomonadaceae bacterium]|nr:hypothetical protein [Pyrinomonadaceae bacterium]